MGSGPPPISVAAVQGGIALSTRCTATKTSELLFRRYLEAGGCPAAGKGTGLQPDNPGKILSCGGMGPHRRTLLTSRSPFGYAHLLKISSHAEVGTDRSTPAPPGRLLASYTQQPVGGKAQQARTSGASGRWTVLGFGRPTALLLHPAELCHRQIDDMQGRRRGTQRHGVSRASKFPSRHAGVVHRCLHAGAAVPVVTNTRVLHDERHRGASLMQDVQSRALTLAPQPSTL